MRDITGKRIAILSTHGFEQSELEVPRESLRKAGATVEVISLATGEIRGWEGKDWGRPVPVDRILSEARPEDYDALVLPGGQMNPDLLRVEPEAIAFIQAFWTAGKVIGAICHAPWLLIEADLVSGRSLTSYPSVRTDVENAGGLWQDQPVIADQGLVTSRTPDDLPDFCDRLIEEIAEGQHRRAAA
jgi:protease I